MCSCVQLCNTVSVCEMILQIQNVKLVNVFLRVRTWCEYRILLMSVVISLSLGSNPNVSVCDDVAVEVEVQVDY